MHRKLRLKAQSRIDLNFMQISFEYFFRTITSGRARETVSAGLVDNQPK